MSQSSQASTIPYELIDTEDVDFIEDLHNVEDTYFPCTTSQSHFNSQTNDFSYENQPDRHIELDVDLGSDLDEDDDDDDNANIVCHDDGTDNEKSGNEIENEGDLYEVSIDDITERKVQEDMTVNTCRCSKFYSAPCSTKISMSKMVEHREFCQEMTKEELDLIIKAQLAAHRCSGPDTLGKKKKTRKRKRPYQKYFFQGMQVCKQVFCFTHAIGKKKLQNIAQSLDKDGITPRVHGLKRNPANHGKGLTYRDLERIKIFLLKYAEDNALPVPGRLPNFRESNIYVLPSDRNSEDIYGVYKETIDELGFRCVSSRSFQRAWKELCPHIALAKPATDLCQKCQNFSYQLSSGELNEDAKTLLLQKYSAHIDLARAEREYYRQQCQSSKEVFSNLPKENQSGGQKPCSADITLHYSWDYAQQVHYPHHAQQTGPIFFRTPRKCSVFGVCSEGSGKQTFYLVDEAECVGKGANAVVSMVHHFLTHHSHGETNCQLHFDNCQGQNKNNTVLWYALWRVMTGLHKQIELSLMIAGHTKFHPDWHFGLWKNRWRQCNVETLEDIADTVTASSRSGHNHPQLVSDGDRPVVFYDWKNFLSRYFKKVRNLTTFQHFVVQADKPGTISCREQVESDTKEISVMKNNLLLENDMPSVICSKGLDPQRQWYLYESIRDFCYMEKNKDLTCPKPVIPKKESILL